MTQTEVSVPSWTMQHNTAVWGDPYVFRPERWFEDPEIRKYMMIFGHGTRVCVCGFLSPSPTLTLILTLTLNLTLLFPPFVFFVLAVSPIPSFHTFLSLPLARMGRGDAARQTVSLHLSPSRSASSRDSPLTFLLFFSPLPSSLVASSRIYSLPVALVTPPPRRRHFALQSRNHSPNQ